MLIIVRCKTINNIDPPILNSLFFFVKMYLISETFRFSHIIKKTVTYSLDIKILHKGREKSEMLKFVHVGFAGIKKETLVLFRCYLKKSNLQCKSKSVIISIINIVLYLYLYIIFCPVLIGLLIAFTICCKCSVGKFLFCFVNGQA